MWLCTSTCCHRPTSQERQGDFYFTFWSCRWMAENKRLSLFCWERLGGMCNFSSLKGILVKTLFHSAYGKFWGINVQLLGKCFGQKLQSEASEQIVNSSDFQRMRSWGVLVLFDKFYNILLQTKATLYMQSLPILTQLYLQSLTQLPWPKGVTFFLACN